MACMDKPDLETVMKGNQEKKIIEATSSLGVIEIYVNEKTQVWSLVIITPKHPRACVAMVGDGWESVRDSY